MIHDMDMYVYRSNPTAKVIWSWATQQACMESVEGNPTREVSEIRISKRSLGQASSFRIVHKSS